MLKRILPAVAVGFILLTGHSDALRAAEEIISFDSVVEVRGDGILDVTETIRVRAEGNQITRGIYRDVPLGVDDSAGQQRESRFELLAVTRDGKPTPYHTKSSSNGIRIYIGEEPAFLADGVYNYVLHYEISHSFLFLPQHTELVWHVTGQEWALPILKARVRIILPDQRPAVGWTAHTGRFGERGTDFAGEIDSDNVLTVTTTDPLAPGEGFSIVVEIPTGLVAAAAGAVSKRPSTTSTLVNKVQLHLLAGQTEEAVAVAEARLVEDPDDDEARFALGAVQFLGAIEELGQSLHRYGLRSSYQDPTGIGALPILRLPVPRNQQPDKINYESLRFVLNEFVSDLQTVETTLSDIKSDQVDLPLNIGLIRLDLNGDGNASRNEALWKIFSVVAGASWLDETTARALLVNFDGSDVAWLRAYCHLLMAIAEFPLAYDWQEAFEKTFHGIFPDAGLPYYDKFRPGEFARGYGPLADLIAFVHLMHWPVVEPERLKRVLNNLEAMVRLSRENWTQILSETDDRNEWIPNPEQTGVLPQMRVDQGQVEGWQLFLDEFEAILEGSKLIPHWRFDQGINMRRFFLEPRTFDIVLMIQGTGAVSYLEDGKLTNERTWRQIMRLFGGDFFRYFVWFN